MDNMKPRKPGEAVLELGGGMSSITALMLKNEVANGVVSYDANPLLIAKIERTIADSGFTGPRLELRKTPGTVRSCPVAVESFNQVVEAVRPSLIVCDIEGGERALFAEADLSGVCGVYLELHQRARGHAGRLSVVS